MWRIAPPHDAHDSLAELLRWETGAPPRFASGERGKPYLPDFPWLRFNLSHTKGLALAALALEMEVGVDVERIRPMRDHAAIAERFFPAGEAYGIEDEREFFRRWTRLEAICKALGLGLTGIGLPLEGAWTIEEIDAGADYAAAVAAPSAGIPVILHEFTEER